MVRMRSPVRSRLRAPENFQLLGQASIYVWPVGQVVKTPPFHGGNRGSSPLRVTNFLFDKKGAFTLGRLAQLGEHLPYKQRVGGSIPSASTISLLGISQAVRQRTLTPSFSGSIPESPAIL